MSNKETAVEWLFNNYVDKGVITIQAIEQALEMEKEQIINAFISAYLIGEDWIGLEDAEKQAEQYYKETYLHQ